MREVAAPIIFALLLSSNAITIFAHGLFGAGSLITGSYLAGSTALLVLLGRWWSVRLTMADCLALGLFVLCSISVATNPPADHREIALLALSFAAYPAARGLAGCMNGRSFVLVLAIIIAAGAIATIFALATQVSDGKPMVFGQFNHAAPQFMFLLAFMLLALLCSRANVVTIASLVVAPFAIFAASQVRFAFVALFGTLLAGAAVAPPERRRFAVITLVVVVSILAGALGHLGITLVYVNNSANLGLPSIATATEAPSQWPATRCAEVNLKTAPDASKHPYAEAIALLPSAGLTGIGLGRLTERSCVEADVHSSVLQTAVELGLPAGVLLVALIFVAIRSLWRVAEKNNEALFALCALLFAVLTTFGYGNISQDGFLFLTLGYGAATASRRNELYSRPREFRDLERLSLEQAAVCRFEESREALKQMAFHYRIAAENAESSRRHRTDRPGR